jgi:hypothetical protein
VNSSWINSHGWNLTEVECGLFLVRLVGVIRLHLRTHRLLLERWVCNAVKQESKVEKAQ